MISAVRDDPSVVDLVERASAGDQAAWDRIVERYAALVWSVCRSFALTGADADDVGASVWLRLVERLGSIREPAALPGWISTTTRRECLQLLKAKSRQIPVADQEPDETAPPVDEWLLTQERHIALRSAFVELSPRCKELLSLLFDDPPTPYTDIGAMLGMAVGAIGPTRQRCLDSLRRRPEIAALVDPATTSTDAG